MWLLCIFFETSRMDVSFDLIELDFENVIVTIVSDDKNDVTWRDLYQDLFYSY